MCFGLFGGVVSPLVWCGKGDALASSTSGVLVLFWDFFIVVVVVVARAVVVVWLVFEGLFCGVLWCGVLRCCRGVVCVCGSVSGSCLGVAAPKKDPQK